MTSDEMPVNTNQERSPNSIDWEGLKRVYDEIESRGGKLELTLIQSVKKLRTQRATVTPQLLHVSIVMVCVTISEFQIFRTFCLDLNKSTYCIAELP